jgi:hypothetical protein
MSIASGTRLGVYEILSPIGAGGMGEVYKARDTRLDRPVAIKILAPHAADDPQFRERFEREARVVSSLSHPHICTLHDVGEAAGVRFLVMEFLEGETLADRHQHLDSWSPDGRFLAFSDGGAAGWDIIIRTVGDKPSTRPFLQTPITEQAAMFSPDRRWLAYSSDESGRPEIYVQPFPGPGGKRQISTDGGFEPAWNRNGRELFYRNGSRMMAVAVATTPSFSAGAPQTLFQGRYETIGWGERDYDVSPDGSRFLMLIAAEDRPRAELAVVMNWFEELEHRVGGAR